VYCSQLSVEYVCTISQRKTINFSFFFVLIFLFLGTLSLGRILISCVLSKAAGFEVVVSVKEVF